MARLEKVLGRFYFVRWQEIEASDMEELIDSMTQYGAEHGRPPVYVAIQGDDYREPKPAVRSTLLAFFAKLIKLIETDYVVIAATGVKASLQRSAMRAMMTVGRIARADLSRVVVLSSVGDVLEREKAHLPAPAAQVLASLREAGILDAET